MIKQRLFSSIELDDSQYEDGKLLLRKSKKLN